MTDHEPESTRGSSRYKRKFVIMAKLAQTSIYVLVCIFIVFTDTYKLAFGFLASLGYALTEFYILHNKSHKVTSLGNNLSPRVIIMLNDFSCLIALSIFQSKTNNRVEKSLYLTCLSLLTAAILLSLTIAIIYDCCPGNDLVHVQDWD